MAQGRARARLAHSAAVRYRPAMEIEPTQLLLVGSAWVLSVGLHEAGHAFSANRLGDPTPGMFGRLTLNPFAHLKPVMTAVVLPLVFLVSGAGILGGATTPINPSYFRKPLRDRLLVALAGPVVNLLLALLFAGSYFLLGRASAEVSTVTAFFLVMVHLNLVLLLFNMLPVPGLDGGDVLRYFLPAELREKFDGARPFGIVIAMVLLSIPAVGRTYFVPVNKALELLLRMTHAG